MNRLSCPGRPADAAVRSFTAGAFLTALCFLPFAVAADDRPADIPEHAPPTLSLLTSQTVDPQPIAVPAEQSSDRSTPAAGSPAARQRRAEVRRLLKQLCPDLSADVIEVWVEEYAGLPDDDIRFLVSQSPLLSRSTNVPLMFTLPGRAPEPQLPNDRTPSDPFAAVSATARHNLNNLTTPGYREEIILTIPGPSTAIEPGSAVRSFRTGEIIETGFPFHLAIETPGRVFFVLDNGLLTRSGLFVKHPDGRLVWSHPSSGFVLKNCPVIPDGLDCTIDSTGRVIGRGGQDHGRIPVVRVTGSASLHTEDGVFFKLQNAAGIVPDENVVIRSGCLELSNVNVERNRSLLQPPTPRIPSSPRNTPAAADFSEE